MKRKQILLSDLCQEPEKKVKLSRPSPSTTSVPQLKETFLINDSANGVQVKYISNFLSGSESTKLFDVLLDYCEFERGKFKMFGKEIISNRKMASFGETDYKPLFKEENYSLHHRPPNHDTWPQELLDLKRKIEEYTGETFTFALVNRYDDGESSIGWHSDVEKDIKENSSIVSMSLGAARDFQFRPTPKKEQKDTSKKETKKESKEDRGVITKKLESGSLVIMNYATQRHFQHTIPKRKNVNSIRLNITFRNVVRNK